MRRTLRRGFTLVELIICMALTGIIAASLMLTVDEVRTDARRRAATVRWASAANTAFAQMGRDVRAGDAITVDASVLQVGAIRWRLDGQVLRRGDEIYARDVKALRWTREGGLLAVELAFFRRFGTHHADAVHATQVALRAAP